MNIRSVLPLIGLLLVSCTTKEPADATSVTTTQNSQPTSTAATASTQASTTNPSPSSTSGVEAAPEPYVLEGIEGLIAVDGPQTETYDYDQITTAWASTAGLIDGFLVLNDVPAPISDAPEGDNVASRVDSPTGRLWLVTDNVESPALPSASRMMWWRDDGRLWIVSNFGVGTERLKELTLKIQAGTDGRPELSDDAMVLIGTDTVRELKVTRQSWDLDGHAISLRVSTGGLASQLSDVFAQTMSNYTVDGEAGYQFVRPDGQVTVIWPTTGEGTQWAKLDVAPQHAARVDEIVNALTR